MEEKTAILEQAEEHVQELLLNQLPDNIVFHTYEHTEEVVKKAEELAEAAGLSIDEQEQLLLAAWFHDTGYIKGAENHEERSAEIARAFLQDHRYDSSKTDEVVNLILSTKPEHEPKTRNEKILHDAGWSFLGRKRFFRRGELYRLEKEKLQDKKFSHKRWNQELIDLQLSTPFLTPWAIEAFGSRKNKNIAKQRKNLVKASKKTRRRKTGKDFGRGIDTIYRVTLRNHISMSEIADGKANMIISINTLVLSILITAGTAGLSMDTLAIQENLHVIAPVLLLMLSGLTAIIFAVFSAMPKVGGKDEISKKNVSAKDVSLLFFGNFLQVDKERFVKYLSNLKNDQQVLYDDLSRDLYNLGIVLKKKYRLLNIAYYVFVGGLVVSFLTFLAFSIFYQPAAADLQPPISGLGA